MKVACLVAHLRVPRTMFEVISISVYHFLVSRITEFDGVAVTLFDGFPLPLPEGCRECGKRKFGRTQPDQALRRSPRPSRSSALCARHALRKDAAARGSARLRASLDRRGDRRSVRLQAGTGKRRSNRTKKHEGRGRRSGHGLIAGGAAPHSGVMVPALA